MAKKGKEGKDRFDKKNNKESRFWNLRPETKSSVLAIIFFGLTIIFLLAGFEKAGIAGEELFTILSYLIGFGYFLIPTLFFLLAISFVRSIQHELAGLK